MKQNHQKPRRTGIGGASAAFDRQVAARREMYADYTDFISEEDAAPRDAAIVERPRRHAVRLVAEADYKPCRPRTEPAAEDPLAPSPVVSRSRATPAREAAFPSARAATSPERGSDPPTRRAASRQAHGRPADPAPPECFTEETPTGYAVRSVYPEGTGEYIAVVLSLPCENATPMAAEIGVESAGGHTRAGKSPRRTVRLLLEQYTDLGVRPGVLSEEDAEALLAAARLCDAVRQGIIFLQYGSPSVRRLSEKLRAKGFDRELADRAATYLDGKGYIREDDTASRRAQEGVRKLWGPRRIREDLRAHGFSADVIDDALATLEEVDFAELCATVIRKKCGAAPADRAARQKLIAALMRLGFDADTIREAMDTVAECEE